MKRKALHVLPRGLLPQKSPPFLSYHWDRKKEKESTNESLPKQKQNNRCGILKRKPKKTLDFNNYCKFNSRDEIKGVHDLLECSEDPGNKMLKRLSDFLFFLLEEEQMEMTTYKNNFLLNLICINQHILKHVHKK